MLVCVQIGLANQKSGDSVSAKLNFEEALKLIDNFSPQERFADFYRQSIAEAQAEMGDTEGADRTLGRIKDDSQRSEGFRTVGLLQAQRGDFKGAILKAPFIDDPENREEFLKSISQMQLEANTPHDSQDSEESFDADDSCADIAAADTINVPEDKARCLAYWGGRLATEGQFSTALEILRRAHQESSLVLDIVVRAYTLKEIARGQAKADSMGDASQSLAEAETLALAEHKIRRGRTSIPRELVELRVEWGDFDGADSFLAQVEEGDKMNALQSVAYSVVENGHEEIATAWANRQISPRDRALVLIGIANALSSPTELGK
jgi:hypothetical protein